MILIFGGTTEGRIAAEVCDRAAKGYLYAIKGEDQKLVASHAEQICGAMNEVDIEAVISTRGIDLIIDAAHPYAEMLHTNIAKAAASAAIPTIRFDRLCEESNYEKLHYFDSMSQVAEYIKSQNICDVLALTGVKSAAVFAPIAVSNRLLLRIMDREESQQIIERVKFPVENIIYYGLTSDDNYTFEGKISAIVTKESGDSGGYSEKLCLAESLDIPLFVVRRPALPRYESTVYGEYGLRHTIESILPKYYELKTGFTTGAAATAAAKAALRVLLFGVQEQAIEITLPNREPYTIPIYSTEKVGNIASASVIKDGGDDPDATHKLEISARVVCSAAAESSITIKGGVGVGRVTLPGVGIKVGEAAINPVPHQMIRQNLESLLCRATGCYDIEVEISVPEGERVAEHTFNPRLGILGGISILGTSGIVQPFSSEAFLDSIARQIDIVRAIGEQTIVINSGARSERFIKSRYPDLPTQCYIHYGNLIGDTLRLAVDHKIRKVVLGVMIGKAVKLAAGALDTHSKRVVIDRDFLIGLARKAECSEVVLSQIANLTTARQLWDILPCDHRFFALLKGCCYAHTLPLIPADSELEIVLISEDGVLV